MDGDVNLVIRLDEGAKAGDRPPLVVLHGGLGDASASLPEGALVVYRGRDGWMASDTATDQVTCLSKDAWSRLGPWNLRLAGEQGGHRDDPYAEEFEQSIVENSGLPPWLLVHDHSADDPQPRRVWLPSKEGPSVLVGRSEGAEVRLLDKSVSRKHLRLWMEHNRIWMQNLGRYPPSVNGERKEGRVRLSHGDTIRVGKSTLVFHHPLELQAEARESAPEPRRREQPEDLEDRPIADSTHPGEVGPTSRDPVQIALGVAILLVVAFIAVAVAFLL